MTTIGCPRGALGRASLTLLCTLGCAKVLDLDDVTFEGPACAGAGRDCSTAGGGSAGHVAGSAASSSGSSGAGQPSGGENSVGPPPTPCTTHGECIERHNGEPHVCRHASCVALKNRSTRLTDVSGDCRVVLGANNLEHPSYEPFLVGVIATARGLAPESSVSTLNYKLAIEQFAAGFPIAGENRLPVAVVCDDANEDLNRLNATFDHLVGNLGITAILAGLEAHALKASFERLHSRGERVFFLSPFTSASLLLNVDDGASDMAPGLLWHLLPSPTDLARTYVPLLARVEAHLGMPADELRLALVESDDELSIEVGTYLDSTLEIDGELARDHGDTRYKRVRLSADQAASTGLLKTFRPHVVVSAAQHDFLPVLEALEAERAGPAPEYRPFYVLSSFQAFDERLLGRVSAFPGLHERVVGVNYASAAEHDLYDFYLSALKARFPARNDLASTENHYDAMYFLLYAASAGATTHVATGPEIARGMWRLLEGPKTEVGRSPIDEALAYLAEDAERTIALWGTLGPPDFDRRTGGRPGSGTVWCVNHFPNEYRYYIEFDVLRYDAGALTGTEFPCFDF